MSNSIDAAHKLVDELLWNCLVEVWECRTQEGERKFERAKEKKALHNARVGTDDIDGIQWRKREAGVSNYKGRFPDNVDELAMLDGALATLQQALTNYNEAKRYYIEELKKFYKQMIKLKHRRDEIPHVAQNSPLYQQYKEQLFLYSWHKLNQIDTFNNILHCLEKKHG